MAKAKLYLGQSSPWLPPSINPKKFPKDKPTLSANRRFPLPRAQPSPIPLCFRSERPWPTRPNPHSLRPWPAVSCNEGFCNASEGQRLPAATGMASQKPHRYANPTKRHATTSIRSVTGHAHIAVADRAGSDGHGSPEARQERPSGQGHGRQGAIPGATVRAAKYRRCRPPGP
jgi:hypothetical protein